jgi:hypothetical protein
MTFTLYQRTFPVEGAPVTLSVSPFPTDIKTQFPAGGEVYEAVYSKVRVVGPDGTKVERPHKRVTWDGAEGRVNSTAQEVFDMARAGTSGFRLAD